MILATLLGVAACGSDDVDLSGVYRVDAAVGSDTGCGADAPLPDAPPFLKLRKDDFFGSTYFAIESCQDQAGSDCPDSGRISGSLFEPIGGGWRSIVTASSGGGTTCGLAYDETIGTLDGEMFVLEHTAYSDQVQLSAADCTTDEAKKRGDSMPCTEHSVVHATRISM